MSKPKSRPFSNCSSCLPLVTKPNHQFLADLLRHARPNRHNHSFVPPSLCGRNIDLRALYNEVVIRGGHKQVTAMHQWNEVYMALGFPPGCVDAGHRLRTIYQRFLESFERSQRMVAKSAFATDDLDTSICVEVDSQDVESTKNSKQLLSAPPPTSLKSEDIPNHLRDNWNLSTDLADRMDYNSLELSLLSNLPNELDFALNTMLLMSSQPNGFSLYKNDRLLDLLLSCVGIFDPKLLVHKSHGHMTSMHHRFLKFWNANVLEPVGRLFLFPGTFDSVEHLSPNKTAIDHCLSQVHDMAYGDDEGFRVQLVATVLRNLAVEGGASAVIIGRHHQALRFLFLCIHANHSSLRQLGLEALSSLHFPVVGRLVPALQTLIPELLTSPDRNDRMRGLQLIGRLCEAPICLARHGRCTISTTNGPILTLRDRSVLSNDRNTGFLCSLSPVVFDHVVQTLCLRDLHLVVLALDAVYNLSCLGRLLCERLLHPFSFTDGMYRPGSNLDMSTVHLLPTLVALLRLEAQAMGSDSVIRLRVMQALPTSSTGISAANTKPSTTPAHARSQPTILPPTLLSKSDYPPLSTTTSAAQQPSVLSRYVIPLPVALTTTTPVNMTIPTVSAAPTPPVQSIAIRPAAIKTNPKTECSIQLTTPSNQPTLSSTTLVSMPPTVSISSNPPVRLPPLAIKIQPMKRIEPAPNPGRCDPPTTTTIGPTTSVMAGSHCVTVTTSHIVTEPRSVPISTLAPESTTDNTTNEAVRSSCGSEPMTSNKSNNTNRFSLSDPVKVAAKPLFKSRPALPYRPGSRKPNRCPKDKQSVSHSAAARLEYMFEWLRKNYVVHSHSSVSRVQIYMDYQRAHQRRFGSATTAVSPVEFHAEIKSVFPGVGQVKVQVPGDKVIIHYNNLRCLHSPESNTEQGVNDIMAAVLSPNKEETASTLKRTSKPKHQNRKRPNPKPLTGVTQVKRVAPYQQPNGHNETKDLVNGRLSTASNGLTKDIVTLLAHSAPSTSLPLTNGTPVPSHHSLVKLPVSTMSNCPKLNELVSRDHGLVIFPVFTTLNFNPAARHHSDQQSATEDGLQTTKVDAPITLSQSLRATENAVVKLDSGEAENSDSNRDLLTSTPLISNGTLTKHSVTVPVDETQLAGKLASSSSGSNDNRNLFACGWHSCTVVCKDQKSLLKHLSVDHLTTTEGVSTINCPWLGCNQTKMFANEEQLLSHLCDNHLQVTTRGSLETTVKGLVNGAPVTAGSPIGDPQQTRPPVMHATECTPAADPVATSPVSIASKPTDLFRHPSNLVGQQRPTDCGSRARHLMQNVAEPQEPTQLSSSQQQQQSCPAIPSESNLLSVTPNPTPVTSFSRPTVWCPPPSLSDECRRALAGGTPNPGFDISPSREGPVTKHIRLTAALALKNLLRYSQAARRFMASREDLLCELAFSGLESSPTIFECLGYLHDSDDTCSPHRDPLPPLSASLLYD